MKILSPKELKDRENLRVQEVREIDQTIAKKTKELNSLKTEFDKKKAYILADFQTFAEGIAGEKALLESGISSTKGRKAQALRSLSALFTEATQKLDEAKQLEATCSEQSSNLLLKEQKLEGDIKNMGQRETLLNKEFERLRTKGDQIATAEVQLDNKRKSDADAFKKQAAKLDKREKELDEIEKELDLGLISLGRSRKALEEEREIHKKLIESDKKKLSEERRQLVDARATLDRAWAELERKKN